MLLDLGGPEAVTLREVGARSGVSRSAAYRHFADKESLLTVLATNAMSEFGDALEVLAASEDSAESVLTGGVACPDHHRSHPAAPVSADVHHADG